MPSVTDTGYKNEHPWLPFSFIITGMFAKIEKKEVKLGTLCNSYGRQNLNKNQQTIKPRKVIGIDCLLVLIKVVSNKERRALKKSSSFLHSDACHIAKHLTQALVKFFFF